MFLNLACCQVIVSVCNAKHRDKVFFCILVCFQHSFGVCGSTVMHIQAGVWQHHLHKLVACASDRAYRAHLLPVTENCHISCDTALCFHFKQNVCIGQTVLWPCGLGRIAGHDIVYHNCNRSVAVWVVHCLLFTCERVLVVYFWCRCWLRLCLAAGGAACQYRHNCQRCKHN